MTGATQEHATNRDTSRAHRSLQILGIGAFFVLAVLLSIQVVRGAAAFGLIAILPLLAIAAYLIADFISGFVHFLADNFGTPETPVVGPGFIRPFREHHDDPSRIVRHDFIEANGNNSLVALPGMVFVLLLVPIADTRFGYLFGAFFVCLCIAVFLTNQFHKWAHMERPPRWVTWLQQRGVVLSKANHDIHHVSPFDTYYCITIGLWNPLLERTRFFERTEAFLRRYMPGVSREKPDEGRVERDHAGYAG